MTPLTPHELEVLLAYARLGTVSDCARELGVSPYTVRNILFGVRRKLGVSSTIQALWTVLGEAA